MKQITFAEKVIRFNAQLDYKGKQLPPGVRIMNPFREFETTLEISSAFYNKYYADFNKRYLILGINPGRFGGGLTGIPFTDPKRLRTECGISYTGKITHEPSSVFVYEVINAFGGPEAFYKKFYINSLCPLGFTAADNKGREKNYNYYDSKALTLAVTDFILENIQKQIELGVETEVCFCFGRGKNEAFLKKLNAEHRFFGKIVGLEHPRFILQYKMASKQYYIDKYLEAFSSV
jgi:hypothetical protein